MRIVTVLLACVLAAPALAQGEIHGTLTDARTGVPVVGANVHLFRLGQIGAASDTLGAFVVRELPLGEHAVRVSVVGYEPELRHVAVTAGAPARLDLRLRWAGGPEAAVCGPAPCAPTGTLRGVVTAADTGEPLIGANVFLPALQRGAGTDLDGAYAILELPVGEHEAVVSFAGTHTIRETVEIVRRGTNELDVALSFYPNAGVYGCYWEPPLIGRDAYTLRVVSGEDLRRLPVGR